MRNSEIASRLFQLAAVLCAGWALATQAHAAPSDQLQELRDRIDRLQRQLAEAEGSKSEAADALRASERSISDANRRLFRLSARSREAKATTLHLEGGRGTKVPDPANQVRPGDVVRIRPHAGDWVSTTGWWWQPAEGWY